MITSSFLRHRTIFFSLICHRILQFSWLLAISRRMWRGSTVGEEMHVHILMRSVPGRPADARRVFPLYWTTWISQPAIDCPLCVVGSADVVASAWVAAWNRCRAVCSKSKKCSTCRICCTCQIICMWTESRKCSKRGSKKCSKNKKCSTCGFI